jgi:hypothetical protein
MILADAGLLSPNLQLVLIVMGAAATVFGPGGILIWLRRRDQSGIDKSSKQQIDQTIANMGDERIASARQEFDRQLNEIRADHAEDDQLARRRYNRLMRSETFIDKVVVYFRRINIALDHIIELIPGGHKTIDEHGIIIPDQPPLPEYNDDE